MKISMGVVGFAVPILAGLVLALIGHPAVQLPPPPVVAASTSPAAGFVLKSVSVELPVSDVAFPGGAKADAVAANCLSCHSAGMVLTQPDLTRAVWTDIVEKMIHAYKAPVAEADVAAIVDYLQATRGAK
ncbi:MAG: cytochrome c [Proteobacteria bacterium]|jgi:mono/diheme cytochrome c family protein|uniref:c-type cytochrome n=1 Tax=Reyranella massiliensis TaxID=445220 RepID=UPI000314DEA3|nr:cytochrome c [Reyranella massiliensis]MCA0247220.1 cytochrome c [Pseudomonadota bacterium]